MTTYAFVGAGNMAQALVKGMLANGTPPTNICASDLQPSALATLAEHGVTTTADNNECVQNVDVVVLAVKPQVATSVLQSLTALRPGQLLISIAAGIDLACLTRNTPPGQPIVRCMPNTPALVGVGMSALFANDAVSAVMRDQAQLALDAVGEVVWVADEGLLDAVTAVSGSGPAYFFYLMEAMVRAGTELGLTDSQARQLTLQTALGAATLACQSESDPATLRTNVTSPGGTTERALNILNDAEVADAIVRALRGAAVRSAELAEEFGAP